MKHIYINKQRIALALLLLLAAFLHLYRLHQVGRNGLGNYYYATATRSMLGSWRNFFYLAVDPAGFISLDKPPLAFWLHAALAKLFGFHGLVLMLPQALAGIASVYVLYQQVSRAYGAWAGLVAALVLTVSPISVVINRSNFPDPLLTFTLLLAAGAMMKALETGTLRWLLVCGVLVGVAFNIKMLQLVLVVPAFFCVYVLAYPHSWRVRCKHAALALLAFVLVAAPWVIAVDLTPPDRRPYVGGSANNSVSNLIFGYNGFARLWAEDWTARIGTPGPFRLFGSQIGAQISWFLPFALLSLVFCTYVWSRIRRSSDTEAISNPRIAPRKVVFMFWATWLVPQVLYFSISIFYHRYYLAMMAPAIAALVGIGLMTLWEAWQAGGWQKWGIAVAIALCALAQIGLLLSYPVWLWRLMPVIVGLSLLALVMLVLGWRKVHRRWAFAGFGLGLVAQLVTPLVWAAIPVLTCTNMSLPLPSAGPQTPACEPFAIRPWLDPDLVAYLEQHRDGAEFLAATYDMGVALLGIMGSDEPFMALGGYRGTDPVLTVDEFASYVAAGRVRFFISMSEEPEYPQQQPIFTWVRAHCSEAEIESPGVRVWGPCISN